MISIKRSTLFAVFMLFNVSAASLYKTFHAEGNKLFEIVQDPQTHDVYIGGRNKIYHLDSTLKLKQEIIVGPSADSLKCLPGRNCPSAITTNNNIIVLEIEPSERYLFACGTVKQGACMKYDLADLKNSTYFLSSKAENFVGSAKSSIAFFVLDPISNTSVLYVAMSYDGRKMEAFPYTISERIISTTKKGFYNLSYRKDYLGIPTDEKIIRTYPMTYIYGFKHKHFVYYVSLQGNQTYIGRVCENSQFYYYVEIRLKCWHENRPWSYATAAKLVDDTQLFVTFWNEIDNKSCICKHSLSEIEGSMQSTIKACYSANTNSHPNLTSWIEGKDGKTEKPCIETYGYDITEDTCGHDENNGYITGGEHVTVSNFVYNGKFTAIQSYVYEGTNLYILGTSAGHLVKIIRSKSKKPRTRSLWKQNGNDRKFKLVMDTDVSQGSGQPIQRDMLVDSQKTHVYAISGSSVIRFPLKSCSVYTSCSTCVTNTDPLNCGWCDGKCTTHVECSNGWSPDCCVPQIKSIHPTKGPVEGGTKLTIRGEYFDNGNPKGTRTVKIGDAPCTVTESNSTNIFCLTTKDVSVKKGNIHVKIKSKSINAKQPKIDGEGRSKEIFYFMVPEIFNFTPTYGPESGGTECNITGRNLDIGSRVTLFIKNHKISIEERTQDKIFAKTTLVPYPIKGRLSLKIDGVTLSTKESYHYKPDPIITSVRRRLHTIKSGGIDIEFLGKNLNTTQNPMISGVVVKTSKELPPEKCISNKNGTILYCKIPPLNMTSIGEKGISADLRLHMDGCQDLKEFGTTHPEMARIYYSDDPILHRFSSDGHIFYYNQNIEHVEIKGKNIIDVVQKKDITITIGTINCIITTLSSSNIFCRPSSIPVKDTEHQKFQTLVKIGYKTYDIGWVLFDMASIAQVDIPIMVLIVILICISIVIIILVYCLWRKKLLFFKEKSSLPTARYAGNEQVHFGENGRLIINSNEYTERQNFLPSPTVGATSCPVIDESILLVLGDKKLLIPKEALQITEKIGQGHFGCVYRALYRKPGEKGEMLVAVKTLHKDHPRDMDIQGFLDEALIMKDFDHENILSLIGICLGKDHMPLVVLPYMAHGDLLSYLRNVDNQPTVKDLIIFGISIASGMDYLASLKFVHRDLAARNCMLNDRLIVKVADFGLSRDIYERDYYSSDNKKSKLPVKWMALESLENGTYNTKTDVWSYGVVLWELFTRGVNPYPTVDNWDMPKYLKSGRRMDKPDYCPNRIYELMLCCWEFDQNLRPDFASIFKELTELSEMEKHRDLPCYQKTPYENVEY